MNIGRAEVSEMVHQYRRLSDLLRQVYLDDTDEEVDVDDLGERYARRGMIIADLAKAGQKMIIRWLSEEDHLYWRLIVLQRKLKDRGATAAEAQSDKDVQHLLARLDTAEESLRHLVASVQDNPCHDAIDLRAEP